MDGIWRLIKLLAKGVEGLSGILLSGSWNVLWWDDWIHSSGHHQSLQVNQVVKEQWSSSTHSHLRFFVCTLSTVSWFSDGTQSLRIFPSERKLQLSHGGQKKKQKSSTNFRRLLSSSEFALVVFWDIFLYKLRNNLANYWNVDGQGTVHPRCLKHGFYCWYSDKQYADKKKKEVVRRLKSEVQREMVKVWKESKHKEQLQKHAEVAHTNEVARAARNREMAAKAAINKAKINEYKKKKVIVIAVVDLKFCSGQIWNCRPIYWKIRLKAKFLWAL